MAKAVDRLPCWDDGLVAMYGRFTQRHTWHEIHEPHGLTGPARSLQAHYNIAPTDTVEVVRPAHDGSTESMPAAPIDRGRFRAAGRRQPRSDAAIARRRDRPVDAGDRELN